MHKNGQVTIFIIIGIIILSLLALILTEIRPGVEKEEIISSNLQFIERVKTHIGECSQKTLEHAVYFTGMQGGYTHPPNEPTPMEFDGYIVPFYLFNNETYIPDNELLEKEMESYVIEHIDECVKGQHTLNYSGYKYKTGAVKAEIVITQNKIKMRMEYPMEFFTNKTSFKISDSYFSELRFDYAKKINLFQEIVEQLKKEQKTIPLGILGDLSEKENFKFGIVDIGLGNNIIYFVFNESISPGKPYLHIFAFTREAIYENLAPHVFVEKKAVVGYPFHMQINISPPFSDTTDLFEINTTTGEIDFTPKEEDVGEHFVYLEGRNKESITLKLSILPAKSELAIKDIGTKECSVGAECMINISVESNETHKVFFIVNSTLDMGDTTNGIISFVPDKSQKGIHRVRVDAYSSAGSHDFEFFNIIIE
ncbi:MAG: hypothetical protein QXK37_01250 [Candidatus Woesearchaeota archaeon]